MHIKNSQNCIFEFQNFFKNFIVKKSSWRTVRARSPRFLQIDTWKSIKGVCPNRNCEEWEHATAILKIGATLSTINFWIEVIPISSKRNTCSLCLFSFITKRLVHDKWNWRKSYCVIIDRRVCFIPIAKFYIRYQ